MTRSIARCRSFGVAGQVQGISGLTIEASDLPLASGIAVPHRQLWRKHSMAEVIGFQKDATLLMSLSDVGGVARGDTHQQRRRRAPRIGCSAINCWAGCSTVSGKPIDGKGRIPSGQSCGGLMGAA